MTNPSPDAAGPGWVPVIRWDEIADGSGAAVTLEGRPVAIFRVGDRAFALGGRCPHQRASLAEGTIDPGNESRGPTVTCPRRGCLRWRFRLADGSNADGLAVACATYRVRVEAGVVLVARGGEA